ncbi:hypothetical protein Leryth_023733 [Lithospermum erythrorhizon]|nr:hypothetical protein Leryth_023733 [Lithospermum erythrorhizon]
MPYGNPNIINIAAFGIPLADVSPSSPSQRFISEDGVINARARHSVELLNVGFSRIRVSPNVSVVDVGWSMNNIAVILDQPSVGQSMKDNPMNAIFVPSPLPVEVSLIQVVGITKFGSYIEAACGALFAATPSSRDYGILSPRIGQLSTVPPKQRTPEAIAKAIERMSKLEESAFRGGFCKDTVTTIWHFHGGCLVGRVVDHDYKVIGIDALRVIDGSTFDYSPGTNPQATVMMLGRYMGLKIHRERSDNKISLTGELELKTYCSTYFLFPLYWGFHQMYMVWDMSCTEREYKRCTSL